MNAYGISITGPVRHNNEDSYFLSDTAVLGLPSLYIVADGMGGHNCGEVASFSAIDFFKSRCESQTPPNGEILDFIIDAANYANKNVHDLSLSGDEFKGMGTTFSACVQNAGKLYIAHIGDSRIYMINDGITQLTQDHTYVNEMVKSGQMTAEQARVHPNRNMLTRALGSEDTALIDAYVFDTHENSKILLCSDGLSNMVSDERMLKILTENYCSNEEAVNALVKAALEGGGFDNCTAIVFDARG